MMRFITILISTLFYISGNAQLPETNLYLVNFDGEDEITSVSLLNNFNLNAYNNQPKFISDDELLITANLYEEQTDIVKLNLKSNTWRLLTKTEESEYSPQANEDGTFWVVRVESDKTTQTLWEYPMNLENNGIRLLEKAGQIGYFQPLNNLKVALFILDGEKNKLVIGNLRNNNLEEKVENIGRCFQKSKNGELIYLEKYEDNTFRFKSYNSVNQLTKDLFPGLPESQDFCLIGSSEDIVMGKGSKLFKYNKNGLTWELWKDLAEYGINNITRIQYRNKKMIVTENL